jgi:uncharacterized LabA/DUF88 family protein
VTDRVMVFVDYQNVYKGARACFHSTVFSPHTDGQVDPLRLGRCLAADSPYDRELAQIRVYRGRPDSTKDPRGYGACTRQVAIWAQDAPLVEVITRTLAYPHPWPSPSGEKPREKGIDVALAVDFATMAQRGEFDVGILMSTDTDLKPALEVVARLTPAGGPRAEVAAWSGADMHNRRLSIKDRALWCHWLDKAAYNSVADGTDYS